MIAGALAVIAQLHVSVAVPDTVRACEPFTVSIVGSVRGAAAPTLAPPVVAPFSIVSSRAAAQTTGDALGGRWSVSDIQIVLLTDRPGRYAIGPFDMRAGRLRARSPRRSVVVVGTRDTSGVPAVVARATIDTGNGVDLRALVLPETVFVGQQATYQVGVFVSPEAREKMRRNPSFVPPQLNELMAYDRPGRHAAPVRRRVGSQCYDVLIYERAVFPLASGRHVLAPAQLSYSLSVGAGFFAGEERREAVSDSAALVAIEPPDLDRPSDYAGAVGDLRVTASVDTGALRVGDPLVLTFRVEGEGNVKLLPRPAIRVPWASYVNGDERVAIDTTAPRVRGSKEFDWILTPREDGAHQLPPVRYPFWNPRTQRYEVAASSAETLTIAPGSLADRDSARVAGIAPMQPRRVMRVPVPAPLPQHPLYLLALAVAPLPALGALAARRRRESPRVVPAAVRLRSLARRRAPGDDATVRRTLVAALLERGVLSHGDFARADLVYRSLRNAGVSADTANGILDLLADLDRSSYAGIRHGGGDAARKSVALLRAVDREARDPSMLRGGRGPAMMLLLAAVVAASAAYALAPPTLAAELFGRGLQSYDASRFSEAAARFDSVASLHPRSADAWANLGTASWHAADTATAVVGWQRALRLEPLAADARVRLDLTPGPARGALAFVPPVPLPLLASGTLLLWWLAWGGAAARAIGRRRPGTPVIYALHGLAATAAVGYVLMDERLRAASLHVVVEPTSLRAEPTLASDPSFRTRTGQIVRAARREGAWTHAVLSTGDDGWIESNRLRSIARD